MPVILFGRLFMKNKGFTLIELIIALAAFSVIIVSMATIANSVIKSQRKTFVSQDTQENARYILESASKELRTSRVNTADSGGSAVTSLNITNANGETVDYRFASNKVQRQVDGGGWQDLNPADLELAGGFYVRKNTFPDRTAVTLVMKVKSTGERVESQKEIYVQSTVAPR